MGQLAAKLCALGLELLDPSVCLTVNEIEVLCLALEGLEPESELVLQLSLLLLD